jgi:hypothetical protein
MTIRGSVNMAESSDTSDVEFDDLNGKEVAYGTGLYNLQGLLSQVVLAFLGYPGFETQ